MTGAQTASAGIYIHIPFCRQLCPYCDFYSILFDEKQKSAFIDALLSETKAHRTEFSGFTFDTVYFGGGTPSLLGPEDLDRILSELKAGYKLPSDPEISIECNPATVDNSKFARFKEIGVNRISLGVQSFHDTNLAKLGRIHDSKTAVESFRAAREAGFENISLDLIYGLPDQTPQNWKEDLDRAIELRPDHISAYNLIIEPGTEFGELYEAGELRLPEEDQQRAMYDHLVEILAAGGYSRYELSNFAVAGKECRHNLKYWHCIPYLGLGPSAVSYDGVVRSKNSADLKRYITAIKSGMSPIESSETVEEERAIEETVMMGLRLSEGLSLELPRDRFDYESLLEKSVEIDDLCRSGFLENDGTRLKISDAGLFLAHEITVRLM